MNLDIFWFALANLHFVLLPVIARRIVRITTPPVIARRVSEAKRNERNEAIYLGDSWILCESLTLCEFVIRF